MQTLYDLALEFACQISDGTAVIAEGSAKLSDAMTAQNYLRFYFGTSMLCERENSMKLRYLNLRMVAILAFVLAVAIMHTIA